VLLPTENAMLRRLLEQWFNSRAIRPRIVGEFEDSALLSVFGKTGTGIFLATAVTADEIKRQHKVEFVERANQLVKRSALW
jgi:LysR family transcriptional activator of nhaA